MEKNKRPPQRSAAPRKRPPMSNYYRSGAQNVPEHSSPFQRKLKRRPGINKLLSRLLDIVLAAALLIGLIYGLAVNSSPEVQVNNTFYHSLDNYRDSAKQPLSAFKNRNKISFDEKGVVDNLMRDYPEIDSVMVELPVFTQQPVVRIKVAAPSFILVSSGHNYLIDANGKAIGLISNFGKTKALPKISDQSNYPVVVGRAVLSSSDAAFITSLIAEAAKSGVALESLILPSTAAELDAKPAGRPYVVKFYMLGDASVQIGQFLAAAHQLDSSGNTPSQYLDARVSGKIFYK